MRKKAFLTLVLLLSLNTVSAQQTVRISGHVKFIEDDFKVSVFRRVGTSRDTLAVTTVDPTTHNYSFEVPFKEVGQATVDCGRWQSVSVWLEDEDLAIDFRGVDTAKVKIKNPPFVYIKGGKNNNLMNLVNFQNYRSYQQMIAISQNCYAAKFADDGSKQALTSALYNANYDNTDAYYRYFVEHYADCNSVLVLLQELRGESDKELVEATLDKLAAQSPKSADLVAKFRAEREEVRLKKERVAEGAVAPDFVCVTEKNKKMRPADFKGKVLVIDFWASWCGPCRQEIPKLKTIYADMNKKEVEFLSVSIDKDKDKWVKAMNEEQMLWKQAWVADAGKEVMDLYQFSGIPFVIVIDKDGKIFRKHVRGEAVREAINDALKK